METRCISAILVKRLTKANQWQIIQFIRAVCLLQYSLNMFAPRVGDKNLPELFVGNCADYIADTQGVKFIENVVQKENGRDLSVLGDKIEVGKF